MLGSVAKACCTEAWWTGLVFLESTKWLSGCSQSKLWCEASHIDGLWAWLRDPASVYKVEEGVIQCGSGYQPWASTCMLTHMHMCVCVYPYTCKPCIHVYSNKKIEKGREQNVYYTAKGLSCQYWVLFKVEKRCWAGEYGSVECLLHTHKN